ncbi:MAG: efflux RND transporter periplasmic adaptor subunit [Gemmatimonadaceae bacterium]
MTSPGWTTRVRTMSTRSRWAMVAGALVLAVAIVWVMANARDNVPRDERAQGGGDDMSAMQGMPGMNMNSDGSVRLTAAQIAQFGVTFGTVDERTLSAEARTTGVVTFDETRMAKVAPKFSGFVEQLHVDFTGQPVRRGQPLLDIYSPELVAAQEELLLARRLDRTLGQSAVPGVPSSTTDLVGAAKRRLRLWDISEAQIDEVLRTDTVRRALTLFSPASGVVVEKHVLRGQAVAAGMTLYTIADLSSVWVDVELREADAASVRQGTGADIDLVGLPGRALKGRVQFVYPMLDTATRTVSARVVVSNTQGLLKPGMYATVRLLTPMRRALTVPTSAVVRTGERSLVFVDMGGGRLMPHEVETGRSTAEHTEVLSGLEPGQRVVTSAQFLLESESNLGEVMRAMMGQTGQMGPGDAGQMKDMPGMDMKGADVKGRPIAPKPAPRR